MFLIRKFMSWVFFNKLNFFSELERTDSIPPFGVALEEEHIT